MKKLSVFAVLVIIGTSVAVAASLAIPWFVDNAPAKNGIPGTVAGVTGIVTLKSNRTDTVTCSVAYFTQEGYFLGPLAPDNTFTIAPLSALAFRPVLSDPDQTIGPDGLPTTTPNTANAGGQEGYQGWLVPDRPKSSDGAPIPGSDDGQGNEVVDTKSNGSCTISWVGGDQDIQGQIAYFQTARKDIAGITTTTTMSYAHLLPPGT
ncbi:MAG TPA: hypothetical protein PKI11_13345 [Candidatus Hydrogenedentes bacterium]|nr:hypothetical protein [Candidatus Hydrogenedentota bacterium]